MNENNSLNINNNTENNQSANTGNGASSPVKKPNTVLLFLLFGFIIIVAALMTSRVAEVQYERDHPVTYSREYVPTDYYDEESGMIIHGYQKIGY